MSFKAGNDSEPAEMPIISNFGRNQVNSKDSSIKDNISLIAFIYITFYTVYG